MNIKEILRKIGSVALSSAILLSTGTVMVSLVEKTAVQVHAEYTADGHCEYHTYDTGKYYGVYIDKLYDAKTKMTVHQRINGLDVIRLQAPQDFKKTTVDTLTNIFGDVTGCYAPAEGEYVPSAFHDARYNDIVKMVVLPEGLKEIGAAAFFNCRVLSSVNVPEGVELIEEYAFYNCQAVRSLVLPSSVKTVKQGAFKKSGINYIEIKNPDLDISKSDLPNDATVKTQYGSKAYQFITAQNKKGGNFGFTEIIVPVLGASEVEIGVDNQGYKDSYKLTPYAKAKSTGEEEKVTLSSSDTKIMTVDQDGTIHAVGTGTAYVIAVSQSGGEAKCKVTVKSAPTKITVSPKSVTLKKGKTQKLTVSIPESNASNIITYESSDKTICTVNASGLITAKKSGKAEVTATTYNGKTAVCEVTVATEVSSVSLNKTSLIIGKGENYRLSAEISPDNATDKTITWKTSDSKVAAVVGGKVVSQNTGTAIITATASNGKKADCKVTVCPSPDKIVFEKTSTDLGVGESFKLLTHVTSGTASNSRIFTTSDKSVCTVSANGTVTGKKTGTAVITVKTYNGKTATCKVTVKKAPGYITVEKTELWVGVGESFKLLTHVQSGTGCAVRKWTTTDKDVCTVSENGTITGVKAGTAAMIVSTYNGKIAVCKVTVKQPATKITLDSYRVVLKKGETFKLYTHVPGNSASAARVFSTSNKSVCTVDERGLITAKGKGSATVTVKTYNGKTANCHVTVK